MATYRVVLDGGANIAVIPDTETLTPESHVWLYHKPTDTWKGRKHLQSVFAHANYWEEPEGHVTIEITKPLPALPLRKAAGSDSR